MQNMSETHELSARLRMLIGEMRNAGFAELKIESADLSVRMVMGPAPVSETSSFPGTASGSAGAVEDAVPKPLSVTAERVGVFAFGKYRAEPGAKVTKGQTLGLIKGISIQDQVVSPISGTIDSVFVQESEIVDFGRALFLIFPD